MRMLLFQNDVFWHDAGLPVFDTTQSALIETDERERLVEYRPGGAPAATESVHVVRNDPQRIELDAVLERPGIVILADVYYPGWRLTIDGVDAPILRANRMMRGAAVREGRHRLVYTYEPVSFRAGAVVSAVGLVLLAATAFWAHRQSRPNRDVHEPTATR
jgi:hypothetical protein